MTDIYKTPESTLVEDVGPLPKLAYLFLALFVLDAIFGIAINLLGSYGRDPVSLVSGEFLLVLLSTTVILGLGWHLTRKGSKIIPTLIYVFIVMALFLEGGNWFEHGIFVGVAEVLIFIDFLLLLVALYMVKFPLKDWFSR